MRHHSSENVPERLIYGSALRSLTIKELSFKPTLQEKMASDCTAINARHRQMPPLRRHATSPVYFTNQSLKYETK